MNILLTAFKRLAPYLVFLLAGFISGMYFEDKFGKPKVLQSVTIEKQKIKGDGNRDGFKNDLQLNQEQENGTTKKTKKRGGKILGIFNRRRDDSSDTTGADSGD